MAKYLFKHETTLDENDIKECLYQQENNVDLMFDIVNTVMTEEKAMRELINKLVTNLIKE